MNELVLEGCTPEPLMAYLKALGILRLVSEQKDHQVCGFWRDGVFVLETTLDREGLITFFQDEYQPTPIVVPWSGSDFFNVRSEFEIGRVAKTPSGSAIIEAFLATDSQRLANYRLVIQKTLNVMREIGVTKKAHIEGASKKKAKANFLARLRSILPDEVLNWIDAASQVANDTLTFNALLGSGGGSDGNTHFSDNFMQNLWDCLPDFDGQRSRSLIRPDIASALFGIPARSLKQKRTAALFDAGAVGGPNAGTGIERESLLNPWNFILALEGCICLAGAVVKRQQITRSGASSFPFAVRMTATGFGSAADTEQGQNEIWLPLWCHAISYRELDLLLRSGRSEVGRRPAKSGLDFARAAVGLGVDTGIEAFIRYGIVRGRVGGENYNTAISLGLFAVGYTRHVALLEELDRWLDQLRLLADEDSPSRFRAARRKIESTLFEFCKYRDSEHATQVIGALGNAEREMAIGGYAQKVPPGKKYPRSHPLGGLSCAWLKAADDQSAEFRIARALAFINTGAKGTGPIRRYLEPVEQEKKTRHWNWVQRGGQVVWGAGDVARNLGAVLIRRLMDAEKNGEPMLPLGSPFPISLDDVATFLGGTVDEEKLTDLIWGLSLIQRADSWEVPQPGTDAVIPRSYALMKLTLLPGRLAWITSSSGTPVLRLQRQLDAESGSGVVVKPEPALLARLRAGDVQGACEIAARRLRASGFSVVGELLGDGSRRDIHWSASGTTPERLLAALLFPISDRDVNYLADLVIRRPSADSLD